MKILVTGGGEMVTPVRIQRGDAVRAKLAELDLTESDIDAAVAWARQHVAELPADYIAEQTPSKCTPAKRVSKSKAGKRSGKA